MQHDQHDDYMEREERRQAWRDRMEMAAGMSNFFSVVLGTVVILILILLLVSLVNWLRGDIMSTFTIINSRL